jgi:hypothetical protein
MPSNTPRPTRRRLLRSAAALVGAGAVAGCGGTAESSGTAVAGPDPDPPDDAVTDPASVVLRAPPDEPAVREATDGTDTGGDESDPQVDEWRHNLIADAETAASLSIADVDGADEARRFLDGTDFDAETVYVERHVVGECYDQRLCWIRWTEERVETSYARMLRPAEAACSADARVGVTHLIRLSAALDPDEVSRFSSSGGSGECRTPAGSGDPDSMEGGS